MEFVKYHGCGNNFLITRAKLNCNYQALAKRLCHRNVGIGADGLIILSEDPLMMRIFNGDGSEASMCGNGIRCFTRYCYEQGITYQFKFSVSTLAGDMPVQIESLSPFMSSVNLSKPQLDGNFVNINSKVRPFIEQPVEINGKRITFSTIFLGTLHTVLFVDDVNTCTDSNLGEIICHHPLFPDRTNVNFVEIIDQKHLRVRTYERGVGWTLACGTGAAASFVVSRLLKHCQNKVLILLPYGILMVEEDEEGNIILHGPAEKIATIIVEDED